MITDERELKVYQTVISKQRRKINIDLTTWKGREDSSVWKAERKRARAFCTSKKCNVDKSFFRVMSVGPCNIKTVPIWAVDCPDCGHALFWSQYYERINTIKGQ